MKVNACVRYTVAAILFLPSEGALGSAPACASFVLLAGLLLVPTGKMSGKKKDAGEDVTPTLIFVGQGEPLGTNKASIRQEVGKTIGKKRCLATRVFLLQRRFLKF
jgi:hypothetical protein